MLWCVILFGGGAFNCTHVKVSTAKVVVSCVLGQPELSRKQETNIAQAPE